VSVAEETVVRATAHSARAIMASPLKTISLSQKHFEVTAQASMAQLSFVVFRLIVASK
jgi:hypothetical protein